MTPTADRPSDPPERDLRSLPEALPLPAPLRERSRDELAVFLDYDGTLTPIVEDPDDARLSAGMRRTIAELAARTVVAIVSGRDLEDVRAKVAIDGLAYAGSHGFDILHPDGSGEQLAAGYSDTLDRVQRMLADEVGRIPGAHLERKRFALTVHDRQVDDPELRDRLASIVADLATAEPDLRLTGGKRIHELRPDMEWDKGHAIEALLRALDAEDRLPLYLGDDLTDEDGFRAVHSRGGVGIVVRGEDDDRPSRADAALETTADVERFLAALLASVDRATTDPNDRH